MNRSVDVVFERMLLLSEEQLAKVEQFVESLHSGRDHITHLLASVSEAAFAAVWNNPEDDVYDGL